MDGLLLATEYKKSGVSREKLGALMMVLSNKYVSKEQLSEMWKEFSDMVKIKGVQLAFQAIVEYKNGRSVSDISKKLGIPSESIQAIISVL